MPASVSRMVADTGMSNRLRGVIPYPHPAFDLSMYYMPATVKTLYPWCRFIFTTIPIIYTSVKKKAAYITTDLVYSGNAEAKQVWSNLLEIVLKLRKIQKEIYYNLEIYGIVPVSIVYPYDRWLECTICRHEAMENSLEWSYENFRWFAKCPVCLSKTEHKSHLVPSTDIKRVSVKIWRPEQIDIEFNPINGERRYIYNIPEDLRQKVGDTRVNYIYVKGTSDIYLEAIKQNKNIEIDPDNLYVFTVSSPTHDDEAYPIPPMLYQFKQSWLYMTLNRAQEAVAADHILPLRILSPREAGGISPQANINLYQWSMRGQQMVERWRMDPNVIHFSAFPMEETRVGGDAKVVGVEQQLEIAKSNLAAGQDLPIQLLTGDMNYNSGSINLRILENLFTDVLLDMKDFIKNFLTPKLQRFFNLPEIEISFKDFKMGDDVAQKQLLLQLASAGYVSVSTLLEKLGEDPDKEKERKAKEAKERLQELRLQQKQQHEVEGEAQQSLAKINGEVQIISAVAQAIAQVVAQKIMSGNVLDESDLKTKMNEIMDSLNVNIKPLITDATSQWQSFQRDAQIHKFMTEVPNHLKEFEIRKISETNPQMAADIRKKMQDIAQTAQQMRPPAMGGDILQKLLEKK
jgi:hypothetical protein